MLKTVRELEFHAKAAKHTPKMNSYVIAVNNANKKAVCASLVEGIVRQINHHNNQACSFRFASPRLKLLINQRIGVNAYICQIDHNLAYMTYI